MKLYFVDHNYQYAVEQMLLTLFPDERPEYPAEPPADGEDYVKLALNRAAPTAVAVCRLRRGGEIYAGYASVAEELLKDKLEEGRLLSQALKLAFYRAALASGLPRPVWGALTGVRPAKLMEKMLRSGMGVPEAIRRFREEYDVSAERTALTLRCAEATRKATASLEERDVCLYIGIPFCPTRCAYCSFVSQSVEKSMALIEPFLNALFKEIQATAEAVKTAGLRPVSVYFGGGTPTTLSADQLETLFTALEAAFDLSHVREITVEAGRPDTITLEKLEVLRRHRVSRVSVNPQTMDDHVLEAIGRRHTAQDIHDALALVRKVGGFQVNMDLIAGLPITVHTLSRKRGSSLLENEAPLPTAEDVANMLDYAQEQLVDFGFEPYYLYRQKFMSGGFENVGWTKPGAENLYNICIMEELCGIIAMGGGASTKLTASGGRIRRMFCPKYPKEYIEKIDQLCENKQEIAAWYTES